MSARGRAEHWRDAVRSLAGDRELRYDAVGGLNPPGGPAALCPGGTNRITGELRPGFWGASCDADEARRGGLMGRAVLPGAVLVKSHMPDLAEVVPVFHVESIERTPGDLVDRRSRLRVRFESVDFNRRFIATVPADHDPVALRELFSPALIDWITRIEGEVDFGITDDQLFMHWRLRALERRELEAALEGASGVFRRLWRELDEEGRNPQPPGPWHAGLEPFPGG